MLLFGSSARQSSLASRLLRRVMVLYCKKLWKSPVFHLLFVAVLVLFVVGFGNQLRTLEETSRDEDKTVSALRGGLD